jgi:UDP-N-acetylmuramoylalanine--D-glutamate ligase
MEIDYSGKSILIVGAARSGTAVARFLLSAGARVVLTDSREMEGIPTIPALLDDPGHTGKLVLELGGHRVESFKECDFVVVSPGVPLSLPYFEISRESGIPVIAEVELAYRHLKGRIIGITGSNGKTTTTTLVSELLTGAGMRGYAAGNIGAPLIDFVSSSTPDDIYAVELSSFQLEGIDRFRPAVGSILNLTPDHMDRYPGFEDYIRAKSRIFSNQQKADFAVLNADDPRTSAMAAEVPSTAVMFSRIQIPARGAFLRSGKIVYRDDAGEKELFSSGAICLKGMHNLENVLAACAMAILAGVPHEALEESVRKFRGVEHRIEFVSEIGGVQYFNDSKATNVDATVKSLEAFPGNIVLIAGGKDKEGDFAALRPLVRDRVKHLVLIGQAAEKIRKALSGCVDISEAGSMQDAVSTCGRIAQPGDVVLLAPACASFDMFQDYEHRGRAFKDAVHRLTEQPGCTSDNAHTDR